MKFKDNFRLGVASASTQIEGGHVNSNWNVFSDENKILDGSNVANATNHYQLYKNDIELMASMNIKDYRLSIEWARIEPQEKEYSVEALQYYKSLLTELRNYHIKPIVTFYHFSHPMWFEEKGAWTKKENVIDYLRFVTICLESFGDLCHEFITINEPNVYAVNSYLFGIWPPEKKELKETLTVMSVFALAHIKAYQLIHQVREKLGFTDTKVSFAHHVRDFIGKTNRLVDQKAAKTFSLLFQDLLTKALFKGKFILPLLNFGDIEKGQYIDFIAINYYTRSAISNFNNEVLDNVYINDLGWEIYPKGLINCAKRLYNECQLPIYITENGTCDNNDSFRCRYLYDHLSVIQKSDLPIERYYHWCFVDNFEWAEGESARFGLVHNDFKTQERTIKKSGEFYQRIIEEKGISEDLYNEFVANQHYHK